MRGGGVTYFFLLLLPLGSRGLKDRGERARERLSLELLDIFIGGFPQIFFQFEDFYYLNVLKKF